jgi:hypothetical protein
MEAWSQDVPRVPDLAPPVKNFVTGEPMTAPKVRCQAPEGHKSALCMGPPGVKGWRCARCRREERDEQGNLLCRRTDPGPDRFCIGPRLFGTDSTRPYGTGYRCPYCWKISQDRLKSVHHRMDEQRQYLQDDLDRRAQGGGLMSSWTDFVDLQLADLYGELSAKQPCHFAFCVCGSLARTEACPWSDIDAFILTEHSNDKIKDFFRNASVAVEYHLSFARPNTYNLPKSRKCANGEKLPGDRFGGNTGFKFCNGGLSPTNPVFVNTPDEMLHRYEEYFREPHYRQSVLQTQARFVFGYMPLFDKWLKNLGKRVAWDAGTMRRDALTEMQELANRPLPNGRGESINVKTDLYRPVQLILHSLALNYGINEVNPRQEADALVKAGHMSREVANLFKETLDGIFRLRAAGHLTAMNEDLGHVYFLKEPKDKRQPAPSAPVVATEGVLATPQQKRDILTLIEKLRIIKKLTQAYFKNQNPPGSIANPFKQSGRIA